MEKQAEELKLREIYKPPLYRLRRTALVACRRAVRGDGGRYPDAIRRLEQRRKSHRRIKGCRGAVCGGDTQVAPCRTGADYPLLRGYFNTKAVKLKALADWFGSRDDDINSLRAADTDSLRRELLAVHGIGPETADSILLYAAGKAVFVIDAYTRRIFNRLGLLSQKESYDACQRLFTTNLAADTVLFNEYHALLVRLAKEACHKRQPSLPGLLPEQHLLL